MSDHEIQIQLSGLIELLANNLYAEPDVLVREMVQNAHDFILRRIVVCEGDTPPPQIRIRIDPVAATIRFSDNGSGLTEPEIHDYLSTIGRSGTRELKEMLQARNRSAATDLIGQFGIGLLSAFTAAHAVEVRTRSCQPSAQGLLWRSEGEKILDHFSTLAEPCKPSLTWRRRRRSRWRPPSKPRKEEVKHDGATSDEAWKARSAEPRSPR